MLSEARPSGSRGLREPQDWKRKPGEGGEAWEWEVRKHCSSFFLAFHGRQENLKKAWRSSVSEVLFQGSGFSPDFDGWGFAEVVVVSPQDTSGGVGVMELPEHVLVIFLWRSNQMYRFEQI